MRLWRLGKTKYADTTLSGVGSLYNDGRWHTRTRVVYAASSGSLASMEYLVHIDPLEAPKALTLSEIEAPDNLVVETIDVSALPSDWHTYPGPPALREIGNRWLAEKRTVLLRVPSAVMVVESNYLINPVHPDASRITVVHHHPYSFDPRIPLPKV
jgi:RES domain-containing protein